MLPLESHYKRPGNRKSEFSSQTARLPQGEISPGKQSCTSPARRSCSCYTCGVCAHGKSPSSLLETWAWARGLSVQATTQAVKFLLGGEPVLTRTKAAPPPLSQFPKLSISEAFVGNGWPGSWKDQQFHQATTWKLKTMATNAGSVLWNTTEQHTQRTQNVVSPGTHMWAGAASRRSSEPQFMFHTWDLSVFPFYSSCV